MVIIEDKPKAVPCLRPMCNSVRRYLPAQLDEAEFFCRLTLMSRVHTVPATVTSDAASVVCHDLQASASLTLLSFLLTYLVTYHYLSPGDLQNVVYSIILSIEILGHRAWAAPRILRWGYKTGFARSAREKNLYPTFPNVEVQANKYQSGELKFSHLYSTE